MLTIMLGQKKELTQIYIKLLSILNREQMQEHMPSLTHQQNEKIILEASPLYFLNNFMHTKVTDPVLYEKLVSRLNEMSEDEIYFYIPQIVYLAIKRNIQQVMKFLVDKSESKQELFWLIYWNVRAFGFQLKERSQQLRIQVTQLAESIEKKFTQWNSDKFEKKKQNYKIQQKIIERRIQHIKHQKIFINSLINNVQNLKKVEKGDKQNKLKEFISSINQLIRTNQDGGIIIVPFRKQKSQNFHSTLVVGILQNQCDYYTIQSKLSYRIVLETIDSKDFETFTNKKAETHNIENLSNGQTHKNQLWEDQVKSFRSKSNYGHFPSYKLRNMIIKNHGIRHEILCMQLLQKFKDIFDKAQMPIFLGPYEVIVLNESSGLLQFITNSTSINDLKKTGDFSSLYNYYSKTFNLDMKSAQSRFIESLAGYSLLTYLLQIKDRHNGNILIDNLGRIIHIDFHYIFSITPGDNNFQTAPFKFTAEYVQVMQGKESQFYQYFKKLFMLGFNQLRKFLNSICQLIEIMMHDSDLVCFKNLNMNIFRDRFKVDYDDQKFDLYCEDLINKSLDNSRTTLYDNFQQYTYDISQ